MTTPEPVDDEFPLSPAETRGGNRPVDWGLPEVQDALGISGLGAEDDEFGDAFDESEE